MSNVTMDVPRETFISPFAVLKGSYPIHFSIGCVVHPFAVIDAHTGPISFGDYCIVEEFAHIVNDQNESNHEDIPTEVTELRSISIGDYNHFKAFMRIVNVHRIGHGNTFESHCCIEGPKHVVSNDEFAIIQDGCVVGAFVQLLCSPGSLSATSSSGDQNEKFIPLFVSSETVVVVSNMDTLQCGGAEITTSNKSLFLTLPRLTPWDDENTRETLRKKCSRLRQVQHSA